ncbi:MAG: hypothetical protein LCH56_12175 [Proteobacteria bacterium]|nr:hypothetical protein [Pseudomonadota bacterium]
MTSVILAFYNGTGFDAAGRSLEEIWSWDHRRLEMIHDFIQWLFPTPEPSRFNPDAPLLSAGDVKAFRTSPELQARARRSLDLMLRFYGLTRDQAMIVRDEAFAHKAHWLQPLNHNHMRLTRIMIFLRLIGLVAEAQGLLACLLDIAAREGKAAISERTLQFWRATTDV